MLFSFFFFVFFSNLQVMLLENSRSMTFSFKKSYLQQYHAHKHWKQSKKHRGVKDHEMGESGSQGHIIMLWDPQNNWDLLRPPRTRASIRLRTIVGKKNGKKHRYYFRLATLCKGVHDLPYIVMLYCIHL